MDSRNEIDPEDYEAYFYRGLAFDYQGDFDRAIVDFDHSIGLNSQYDLALVVCGLAYKMKGQYDLAISYLSKSIEIDASYATRYYHRGELYALVGEQEKAISDLERALELGLGYEMEQDAEDLLEDLR